MDDGNKGCLIFTVIVVLLIIILPVVSSLDGGSSYSHEYRTNSKYKSDVDSIADTYGISSSEVDSKIKAVTGGY